ncbi:uncharacterized protein LOC134285623 [Aedes albopictus]|uniref:Uncharacterized protein n=1 Tax=Aedes albopictus TaxID=7160 RepID=A0ABM1ZMT7_AEDAL
MFLKRTTMKKVSDTIENDKVLEALFHNRGMAHRNVDRIRTNLKQADADNDQLTPARVRVYQRSVQKSYDEFTRLHHQIIALSSPTQREEQDDYYFGFLDLYEEVSIFLESWMERFASIPHVQPSPTMNQQPKIIQSPLQRALPTLEVRYEHSEKFEDVVDMISERDHTNLCQLEKSSTDHTTGLNEVNTITDCNYARACKQPNERSTINRGLSLNDKNRMPCESTIMKAELPMSSETIDSPEERVSELKTCQSSGENIQPKHRPPTKPNPPKHPVPNLTVSYRIETIQPPEDSSEMNHPENQPSQVPDPAPDSAPSPVPACTPSQPSVSVPACTPVGVPIPVPLCQPTSDDASINAAHSRIPARSTIQVFQFTDIVNVLDQTPLHPCRDHYDCGSVSIPLTGIGTATSTISQTCTVPVRSRSNNLASSLVLPKPAGLFPSSTVVDSSNISSGFHLNYMKLSEQFPLLRDSHCDWLVGETYRESPNTESDLQSFPSCVYLAEVLYKYQESKHVAAKLVPTTTVERSDQYSLSTYPRIEPVVRVDPLLLIDYVDHLPEFQSLLNDFSMLTVCHHILFDDTIPPSDIPDMPVRFDIRMSVPNNLCSQSREANVTDCPYPKIKSLKKSERIVTNDSRKILDLRVKNNRKVSIPAIDRIRHDQLPYNAKLCRILLDKNM